MWQGDDSSPCLFREGFYLIAEKQSIYFITNMEKYRKIW